MPEYSGRLTVNYRSHSDLVKLYSSRAYKGTVTAHRNNDKPTAVSKRVSTLIRSHQMFQPFNALVRSLKDPRWFAVDVRTKQGQDENRSRYNTGGINVIVKMVEGLLSFSGAAFNPGVDIGAESICVVDMYGADRMRLSNELRRRDGGLGRLKNSLASMS